MFKGCGSLVRAPKILAPKLAYDSCLQMFAGCSSLSEVEVCFTDWGDELPYPPTSNWMLSVPTLQTSVFKCPHSLNTETRGITTVPENWQVNKMDKAYAEIPDYYGIYDNTDHKLTPTDCYPEDAKVEYSFDGLT